MRAGIVTSVDGGAYMVLVDSLDRVRALGPMEAAGPAPVVDDRVLVAERLDVPGTWVIVAVMPPA